MPVKLQVCQNHLLACKRRLEIILDAATLEDFKSRRNTWRLKVNPLLTCNLKDASQISVGSGKLLAGALPHTHP